MHRSAALAALVLGACLVGSGAPRARAADHREAPTVVADDAADIGDVFAFVDPEIPNKTVLIMSVAPFRAPGSAAGFSDDVLYQFKVDNDADSREDVVLQFRFTPPGASQSFSMFGPDRPRARGRVNKVVGKTPAVTGAANGSVVTDGEIDVACGLFDDPFFFDAAWVTRQLGLAPGGPLLREPGFDTFAGFNMMIIAVRVPNTLLTRSASEPNIRIWATTNRATKTSRSSKPLKDDKDTKAFVQVDRTAVPALSTALIPGTQVNGVSLKDAFNRGLPVDDIKDYREIVVTSLVAVNGDRTYSETITDAVLLPDVLRLDTSAPSGFPNGRRLQDDVIDIVLNVASNGAVSTDGVGQNDVPLRGVFPYVAAPHTAAEPIPARDGE